MKRSPISRQYALAVAHQLHEELQVQQIPVKRIFVFGSAATGNTHQWSDIDIAVLCDPFLETKFAEQQLCNRIARDIDVRAEVVCLHQDDLDNRLFTLAQEVKRYGVPA